VIDSTDQSADFVLQRTLRKFGETVEAKLEFEQTLALTPRRRGDIAPVKETFL
jgi:hypothetical protein